MGKLTSTISNRSFICTILGAVLVVSAHCTEGQPIVVTGAEEKVDLAGYSLIRQEGLKNGKVMQFASTLTETIGPRLTGSPAAFHANEWTLSAMRELGLEHVHLDDWGEFGLGWTQNSAWAQLVLPSRQPLWIQAGPWSKGTSGTIQAETVLLPLQNAGEVEALGEKINGKIVLLGSPRDVHSIQSGLSKTYSNQDLASLESFDPHSNGFPSEFRDIVTTFGPIARMRFAAVQNLLKYHPLAILEPSRDGAGFAGSGIVFVDNTETLVEKPFSVETALSVPYAVILPEQYNRLARLAAAGTPPSICLNIDATVSDDHSHGFNSVGEIVGTDPKLKNQVVLLGAHLDSWYAGTGATDNAAGVAVALEAMRLLKSLPNPPRRTIRLALWTGEEQGELGSTAYVKAELSNDRSQSERFRTNRELFDAYFNLDNGSGKIRGVYTQGDERLLSIFRDWISPLSDLGVTVISNQVSGSSDGEPFADAGLASFQFLQDPLDYATRTHHSNLDTLDHLDADALEQAAIVEAIFAWNASQRDEKMPRLESQKAK